MRPEVQFLPVTAETERLLPDADLAELFRSKSPQEVLNTLPEFQAGLRKYDALHLLGLAAIYIVARSSKPSVDRNPGYALEVANLEILQAMLLSSNPVAEQRIIEAAEVEGLWTQLRRLHFAGATWDGPDELTAEQKKLASGMKIHSAYYRNQYGRTFFGHMSCAIAKEYDHRYDPTLLPFFAWLIALLDEIERRLDRWRDCTRTIMRADLSQALGVARGLASRNPRAAKRFSSEILSQLPPTEQRMFFYDIHDACADEPFGFTHDQLRALSADSDYDPIPDLDRVSLSFGDLAEQGIENLSVSNPVWSKPFVRAADQYFLFSPFTVLSFPFPMFLAVIGGDQAQAKNRLELVRGTLTTTWRRPANRPGSGQWTKMPRSAQR